MLQFSQKTIERFKKEYPQGTRIKLIQMYDFQAPPPGTLGTIKGVDDAGNLLVQWDNGSSLNILYGLDDFVKIN